MQFEINRLSQELLFKEYVQEVEQVGLVLRVNGVLQFFPEVGPCRLRRSHKNRKVTIDVVIPEEEWHGKPRSAVCQYIIGQVELALLNVIHRLKRDKLEVSEQLLVDFNTLKQQYLRHFLDG